MGSLTVPASGMTLVGSPTSNADDNSSKTATHPVQVMRLDLAPGVLNDFLKSPLSSTKKIHISFGRVVVSPAPRSMNPSPANDPLTDTALWQQTLSAADDVARPAWGAVQQFPRHQ